MDITVTRDPVYGSLCLAAIVDGYRVAEVYYGYTEVEALDLFYDKHNETGE